MRPGPPPRAGAPLGALALLAAAPVHGVLSPGWREVWTVAVIAGGLLAVHAGIRRNRPGRDSGWPRFAAGLTWYASGDIAYVVLDAAVGDHPVRTAMWALGLLGVPVAVSGLVRVLRSGNPTADVETSLDAAITAVAVGALTWHALLMPMVAADGWTSYGVLGGTAFWLLVSVTGTYALKRALHEGAIVPSLGLLAMSIPLTALTSLTYFALESDLPWAQAPVARILMALSWATIAGATWHPSMRTLARAPVTGRHGHGRVVLLATAILLVPGWVLLAAVGVVGPLYTDPVAVALIVVLGVLCTARVVGSVRMAQEGMEVMALQASTDPLTGLLNRTELVRRLRAAVALADGAPSVTVLWLDLDRFKAVNDTHGHPAGDQTLVVLADRLREVVPEPCHVARVGGDEFVVVIEQQADPRRLRRLAEGILASLRQPLLVDGGQVDVSVSIGMARLSPVSPTAEDLLADADIALYRAKALGRDRVVDFDASLRQQQARAVEVEQALRTALRTDGLALDYQPVVDLADGGSAAGGIVAVEALLRWAPGGPPGIGAAEVVRVAEEAGLVDQVGRWVLGRALDDLAGLLDATPDSPLRVLVNVSALEVRDPAFAGRVLDALAAAGVDPGRLVLEITETVLLEDREGTAGVLAALRAAGVGLAIDDFGTGYSALSTLRQFRFDVLKIDRGFIAGLGADPEDTAIVGAILGIARAMGLQVIAEGIEREETAERLRRLGCQLGQGFHLHRPSSWSDVTVLLVPQPLPH